MSRKVIGDWIPTTERKPFEDGKYLVTIKYEDTPEPVVTTREYFVKSGWEHAHLKKCAGMDAIASRL